MISGPLILLLFFHAFALNTPSPCQTCLTYGLWNLGWCGNTSYDGMCILGWSQPPPTCKSRWNFHFCPEEQTKTFGIESVPYRNITTYTKCGVSNIGCQTDRVARVIPGFISFTINYPNHYVVTQGYVSLNASYCCGNDTGPLSQIIDLTLGSYAHPNLNFPVSQCFEKDTIETRINLQNNQPWWTFIAFGESTNFLSITTYSTSCNMWLYDSTLTVQMIDIDPYIQGNYTIPYDDDEYDFPDNLTFTGSNFLKFDYVCVWALNGHTISKTDAYLINTTTQVCDFMNVDLPDAMTPDTIYLLHVTLLPIELETLKTEPAKVLLYYQPKLLNVTPAVVTSLPATITINGSGFSSQLSYKIYVGTFEGYHVTATSESLTFRLLANFKSEVNSFCVRVFVSTSAGQVLVSANAPCLNLTFIPIPLPIGFPISPIAPPIIPTPTPDSPDTNSIQVWFSEHPWIWAIIFIIGALVIICIILVSIKARRSYKGSFKDEPLLASHRHLEPASNLIIERKDIEMKQVIGQGGFATIYLGYWHGTEVAVKVIKGTASTQSFIQEARLMRRLRHPNIVAFLGLITEKPDLSMVTEYLQKGSLHDLLRRRYIVFEPGHLKQFIVDTCKGMFYLHANNIIHRDLKCHNLLVDKDWNLKVGDFGLSRAIEDVVGKNKMTVCGTPSWAAPEVMRHQEYTLKADVYSFAVCLWEMCTRKLPYAGIAPYQVVISVATKGMRPEMDDSIPPYFVDLMELCWAEDPQKRPPFSELLPLVEELEVPAAATKRPYKASNRFDTVTDTTEPEIDDMPFSDL